MNSQTLNFFVKIPCGNVLLIPAVFARIRLWSWWEARIRIEIRFRIRAEVVRTWGNPDPQQWPHLQYNFFFSLSPSKLQISCFFRQHLACICHWSHLHLPVLSPQTATPAWRPTPTGNLEIFFPFSKKNDFCSDQDTDTTRGLDPDLDPSKMSFWDLRGSGSATLLSPTTQIFTSKYTNVFFREHLACTCYWCHPRLPGKSPQIATPAWWPTLTGKLKFSFSFFKKKIPLPNFIIYLLKFAICFCVWKQFKKKHTVKTIFN